MRIIRKTREYQSIQLCEYNRVTIIIAVIIIAKHAPAGMDFHKGELHNHCRVCARPLHKERVTHACTYKSDSKNYPDILQKWFNIKVDDDNPNVHPQRFCNTCYTAMQNYGKATKPTYPSLIPFNWSAHTDDSPCRVSIHNITNLLY